MKQHRYKIVNRWTGNTGKGTANYRAYSRDHEYSAVHKLMTIPGSSDPSFRGDPQRYNPEELFVASLSSCHMLWFLHLCATNEITVVDYVDEPEGIMQEEKDGSGFFSKVTLYPKAKIKEADKIELAKDLHAQAHQMCFIAKSCNFPVLHEVQIDVVS
jgi:organic hydroperoxide reductase OsmC/OhrA